MVVLACVNTPVAVPPSATQFVRGLAVVPQHVPRAVMASPPSDVMFAPSVAVVFVMDVAVGEVSVGALAPADISGSSRYVSALLTINARSALLVPDAVVVFRSNST